MTKLSDNFIARLEQVSAVLTAGYGMIAFAGGDYAAGLVAGMGAVAFGLESIRHALRAAVCEIVQAGHSRPSSASDHPDTPEPTAPG